jgi:hypothetical protein
VGAGTDAAWAVLTAPAGALAAGALAAGEPAGGVLDVLVPAADAPVPLVVADAGWAAD